jgi:hypothetical protein
MLVLGSILYRLLKNAHLRRCPAASPSRRRGKKSLLTRRDATPHLSSVGHTLVGNGLNWVFLISLKKKSFSTDSTTKLSGAGVARVHCSTLLAFYKRYK